MQTQSDPGAGRAPVLLAAAISAPAMVLGVGALIGGARDNQVISWLPVAAWMEYSSAFTHAASGGALLAIGLGRKRLPLVLLSLTVIFSLSGLIADVAGVPLGAGLFAMSPGAAGPNLGRIWDDSYRWQSRPPRGWSCLVSEP